MTRGDEHRVAWLDDEPPPTDEELRAAEALRLALETNTPKAPGPAPARAAAPPLREVAREGTAELELARALQLAVRPTALPTLVQRRLLDRHLPAPRWRQPAVWAAFAAAAVVALGVTHLPRSSIRGEGLRSDELRMQRSTGELFTDPLDHEMSSTERIDTIAQARSRDFRSNWYVRHGVGGRP